MAKLQQIRAFIMLMKLSALHILHSNVHKKEIRKLTLVDKANVMETSRLWRKTIQ